MRTFAAALLGLAVLPLAGPAAAEAAPAAAQQPAPVAPTLEFVFEETVELGQAVAPGDTMRGGRNIIPILGGRFEGPEMRGQVLPGGWDWQLRRADGCTEVKADYFLKTDDGVVINVVNTGALCPGQPGRTQPAFEVPRGKYEWMNKSAFIGTLERAPNSSVPAVRIRFYRAR